MKISLLEKGNCVNCKNATKAYAIFINKKNFCLCDNCLNALYVKIGELILPKSPTSILKKDIMIKRERF